MNAHIDSSGSDIVAPEAKRRPSSGDGGGTAASDRNLGQDSYLRRISIFGAAGAIVVALMGLLGYVPGLGFLGSVHESFIPMAPSTAISFIVLGGILLAMTYRSLSGASLVLFGALAALVSLFGALEVAGHFTGRDLNFEDALAPAVGYLGEIPLARMSPSTGALFFLAGLAACVLLLRVRTHGRATRLGHCGGSLGCLVFGVGLVFCLSYLFGSPLLYGQGATVPMALTTALAFLMLGAAAVGVSGKDAVPTSLLAGATRATLRMSARRRFLVLALIMVAACGAGMAIMTVMLYRHNIEEHREQLQTTVQSQARLIEAMARHDSVYERDTPGGAMEATLSQIVDAHEHYEGFGATGEFTLARLEGDHIVFVLRHRHGAVERPAPVAFDSDLAEPMRRALQGLSGTVIGLDYRGATVLAAHEPVAVLNLGIVAKVDLDEIRAPFIKSGLLAAAAALVVVLAGTTLFFRIGNPIIERLEAYSRDLEKEVEERKRAEETLRESEERMELALQGADLGTWDWNVVTGEVQFNKRWMEMLGYASNEIEAHVSTWEKLVHPDDMPSVMATLNRHMEGRTEFYETEHRLKHKSGEWVWVLDKGRVTERDVDGKPLRACGTHLDITERKRAGEALKESGDRLRLALRAARMGVWEWDIARNCVEWSPETLSIFGVSEENFGGTYEAYLGLAAPDVREEVEDKVKNFLNNACDSAVIQYEHEIVRGDGQPGWVEVQGTVFLDKLGQPMRMTGVCADISERKRAEEALRQSEEHYRNLFETMTQGVVYQDAEGRVTSANPAAERILGLSLEQMQGRTSSDPRWRAIREDGSELPGETHPAMIALRTGTPVRDVIMGIYHPVRDEYVWARVSAAPQFKPGENRPYQVYATIEDITQRKGAEEALLNEKLLSEDYINSLPGLFYVFDEQRFVRRNRAWEEVTGYSAEELGAMYGADFFEGEDKALIEEAMLSVFREGVAGAEAELVTKDGRRIPYYFTGSRREFGGIPHLVGLGIDITDRKEAEAARLDLEAQLHQSQKMEAIGQLAGGVAHDFNNILTAILGNVELSMDSIRSELGADHDVVQSMEQIELSAQRASALTGQLLTFSRRDVVQPKVLNLNRILADLDKMLQRLITEDITLEMVVESKLKSVLADAGQIAQVVVNLVVNAVQAMPDGGRLTLETQNVTLEDDYTNNHAEAQPGPHVLLAVSDTGHGMDAATLERIFEPFFTTKPVDKGTGLGLATVHGIVKQSGGHIMVYSEPGRGTTFKVYLPPIEVAPVDQTHGTQSDAAPHGSETILLCEDDEPVRELVARSLRGAGYTVITAGNGREGVEAAQNHAGPIDLLIADVIMPDMNGRVLSNHLCATRPDLPTLYISGYTSNVIAHHGVLEEGVEFLEKPFTRQDLLTKVRAVLNKTKSEI